jgi:hypothetical protein
MARFAYSLKSGEDKHGNTIGEDGKVCIFFDKW